MSSKMIELIILTWKIQAIVVLFQLILTRWRHNHEGNLVGKANVIPIPDTRVLKVEFNDGHIEEYSTNSIVEGKSSR
jgi:hypothetical protein